MQEQNSNSLAIELTNKEVSSKPVSIGDVFGRLTVTAEAPRLPNRRCRRWEVRCSCGSIRIVRDDVLKLPCLTEKSCGRALQGRLGRHMRKHGMYESPEYGVWEAMKARCNNPANAGYKDYGGMGISVCDQWNQSFEAFYKDMGPRPSPKHSLDRYPNQKGNYEPSNCRWATWFEQSRNKKSNRFITAQGLTMCATEWATKTGISENTIRARLRLGWPDEQIVSIIPSPLNCILRPKP